MEMPPPTTMAIEVDVQNGFWPRHVIVGINTTKYPKQTVIPHRTTLHLHGVLWRFRASVAGCTMPILDLPEESNEPSRPLASCPKSASTSYSEVQEISYGCDCFMGTSKFYILQALQEMIAPDEGDCFYSLWISKIARILEGSIAP